MNVGNCNPVPAPQCRSPVKLQNGNGSCSSWQNGASGQGAVQNFCGNMSRERRSESREIIKKLPQEDDGRGAGGPDALQTSSPERRQSRLPASPHCGPSCLTLPGCARQLLNRRSGSARLRSTASQLRLAALQNAKQFSHMRSRR